MTPYNNARIATVIILLMLGPWVNWCGHVLPSLLSGRTALASSQLTRMTSTQIPRPNSLFSSNPSDDDTTRSHRVGNGRRDRLTPLGSTPSSFHPSFPLSSHSTRPKIMSKICSWEPQWSICKVEQTKTFVKSWTLKGTSIVHLVYLLQLFFWCVAAFGVAWI